MHGESEHAGDALSVLLAEREAQKRQWLAIHDSIVIVAGSRTFNHYALFKNVMDDWLNKNERHLGPLWCFLSGDARDGADAMIQRYVAERGDGPCPRLPALWDAYGRRAGMLRNHEMGDIATHLVAFWDCQSRGTLDMITYAQRKQLHVTRVLVDPDQ